MSVVFLTKHNLSSGTSILRVKQPAEYITALGRHVSCHNAYSIIPNRNRIVFFHRVLADNYTILLINYLRSIGCVIVYDCDDLIFDGSGGNYLCRIGKRKNDGSELFRNAMVHCDFVTVSTNFLKIRAEQFHSNVRVIRNALSKAYFDKATKVYNARQKKRNNSKVVVAYLSGSSSHNNDFKIIENHLIRLLYNIPDLSLLIVGHLDFSYRFYDFGDRFKKQEFVPYDEFVNIFEGIDINLVPLESEQPFCNGKSELKYIEAGACGVPSVCSPTHTHAQVIKHGDNGLLADDFDWYNILIDLISNEEKRKKIGEAARSHVVENYSPDVRIQDWDLLLKDIISVKSKDIGTFQSLRPSIIINRLRLTKEFVYRSLRKKFVGLKRKL